MTTSPCSTISAAGKNWDMSRRDGGLRMLAALRSAGISPRQLHRHHRGAQRRRPPTYGIPQKHIALLLGSVCANIDLTAAMRQHVKTGAEITAICSAGELTGKNHRYVIGDDGMVSDFCLTAPIPARASPP